MTPFCLASYMYVYVLLFHTNNYRNFEFGDPPPPYIEKGPPINFKILYKNFFYTITCLSANKRITPRTTCDLKMTLVVEPELGVQINKITPSVDLKDRMESAANTAKELGEHGLDVEPSKEDKDVAAKLVVAYAGSPAKTSKKVTPKRVAALTPASLILTNSILQEFGRSVVESSVQIRHLVTNKLLLETDNPDPRVRIRALELLGKISDVGLFAEKSEVTITHQSTDDIKEKLRSKLAKLVNPPEEIENAVIIDGEPVDVNAELGIDDAEEGFDDE